MSRRAFSTGRARSHDGDLDVDVNIVPIIDCLTIIITFLLATGVYVSIYAYDIGIAAPGEEVISEPDSAKKEPPKIDIYTEIKRDMSLVISVTGEENNQIQINPGRNPASETTPNYKRMKEELARLKERFPKVVMVTIASHPEVPYQMVIGAMEAAKDSHKDVLLGGF